MCILVVFIVASSRRARPYIVGQRVHSTFRAAKVRIYFHPDKIYAPENEKKAFFECKYLKMQKQKQLGFAKSGYSLGTFCLLSSSSRALILSLRASISASRCSTSERR